MKGIKHVMFKKELSEKFKTDNAILKVIPYKPKILILGTFNPDTPKTNHADFFYGRNYFWTGFKNLFIHKEVKLTSTRMPKNGKPKKLLNPDLSEILKLCEELELTFADLIIGVLHNGNPEYQILDNEKHPDAKLGINGNRTLSSLYDIITATKLDPRFQQKIGQWNHGKIVVHSNNVVEHWLNGFKVLEYTKDGPAYMEAIAKSKFAKNPDFAKVKVSPILLQDHGDAVSYKNIKIRKID